MISRFLSVVMVLVFAVDVHAREVPPMINDIARPVTPARETKPESPWWLTVSAKRAEVPDGPMCLPFVEEDIRVTPPTHLGVLLQDPATEAERVEVATQIMKCKRSVTRVADPFMVLAMLRLETELGIPDEARGLLGSAWCWEAAMRTKPRAGDEGHSLGPFQMQAWLWGRCGLPMRDDVVYDLPVAARCYWSLVTHFLDDGKCPGNVRRAEAMAANGMKYNQIAVGQASFVRKVPQSEIDRAVGRGDLTRLKHLADLIQKRQDAYCDVQSLHWAELQRWRAPAEQKKAKPTRVTAQ